MTRLLKRYWVPLVMLLVVVVAAFTVSRLHGVFGSDNVTSAGGAGAADAIVQFNPKHVLYEVWGPPGAVVEINYLDEHATPQKATAAALPWRYEIVTTDSAVIATVVAQGQADTLGCRITVNGDVRDERTTNLKDAQTYCIVKSA
jgi:hypothetical protein